MKLSIFVRHPIICICVLLSLAPAIAQDSDAPGPDLNSPYGTMRTHLYYLQHDSYNPDLAALTIPPSVPDDRAKRLAIQLKQILDGKGLYVRLNMIPQSQNYTDSTAHAHIFTPFPKQLPEVYLERIDSLWYYSKETIATTPALHRQLYPLGADLLTQRIPDWLRGKAFGLALWQYLGILAMLLLSWILHAVLSRVFRPIVRWIANHIKNLGFADPEDVRKAARILSLLFIVFAVGRVFPVLQLPILWAKFITTAIAIISAVLWMTLGLVVVRIVTKRFRVLTAATESKMDDQLLPIVRKLLQIGVVIVAAVYILSRLNFNVAALIAGLSIGALALALAAQDTVKNLIGSVMIFIDKPFQIGDFVTVDGQEGTITEVGFRSTRIMLVDTSIVSIPNGNVANITVLNLGVRKMRLMNILIGVTYDTPPEKIEAYIAELKQLIQDHPGVHKEEWKVYFRDMGDFALKIMFRCYIPVFTFDEELRVKEELYLKIMRIAQRLEIEFAFPSQTIYLEK
jgi:MscS family membrane protein